ncbi:hypothetical protein QA649_30965 [Bradyrhizobium sp. CB1717]|uniref:hypothetical protein n=1 Tax=Bradyrhizobium sp. CB1717 TaxID=3039154 RepID=UPI0024B1599D|nr:hypothetical protein [Bradyrhizobium sp. CB1717]WFU22478.1 hypothetical protein QA649_30965 [Bradyrhizobium sp. CB1717]
MKQALLGLLLLCVLSSATHGQTAISPVCSRQSSPTGLGMSSPVAEAATEGDEKAPVAQAALKLAFAIENSIPDPYIGVSGNFDGQGLSLGLIQFNLGGSIQKTFGPVDDGVFASTMPKWGDVFRAAVKTASPSAAIKQVLVMQDHVGKRWIVKPDAIAELQAFLGSREARAAQDRAVALEYKSAYRRAAQWAQERGAKTPTPREIATFVDNQVFSGGFLGHMWLKQAKQFRDSFKGDDGAMIAFVGKWLRSCPASGSSLLYGADEGKANADVWRSRFPSGTQLSDERALLFVFGFVRALTANGPPKVAGQPDQSGIFKSQVVQRRALIALGTGKANGIPWPGGVLDD